MLKYESLGRDEMNSILDMKPGEIRYDCDVPALHEFSVKITGRVAEIVQAIAMLRNCTIDDVVISALRMEYDGQNCTVGHAIFYCDEEIKNWKEVK